MTVLGNGNVGIGTTAPSSKLEVNGVGSFSLGTALLPSHSFTGDLNTGMWSSGADTINLSTAGSERVRVTSTGNVGIGTTSPGSLLHVVSPSSGTLDTITIQGISGTSSDISVLKWQNSSASALLRIGSANGTGNSYINSLGAIAFGIGNATIGTSEAIRITTAGNVGIGTTAPTSVLHLKAGTATAGTAPLGFTSGTLLTVPVAGKVEFLTDDYYATITTSAVRKRFALIPTTTSPTYTTSNVTEDRTYDANATTIDELADILGTLIADLKATNIIQ
jgi:hypothetical protein